MKVARVHVCAGLVGLAALAACSRRATPSADPTPPVPRMAEGGAGTFATAPTSVAPGAPRAGMAWVPPGVVRAGTPLDRSPRIADEELPGTEVPLGGFYVDELPYPNEPGAIPVANVTRDEASRLCETQGKRLCTELEWERACEGPAGSAYEYGDAYRASVCGTGARPEQAARRPSGERNGCRSAFGVRELHGGPWEWTDSTWKRGAASTLGVLKGGSAVAGEIAGRCSNAIARAPGVKSPTMGFRCCAGPRNDAEVSIPMSTTRLGLERVWIPKADPRWGPSQWTWRPVKNEEILVRGECVAEASNPARIASCTCRVFREGAADDIVRVETGRALCGVLQPTKDTRDLRMIYMEALGRSRTVRYAFGKVDVSEPR